MDNHYRSGPVRVRIGLGRATMGGPTRVTDPDVPSDAPLLQQLFQVLKFSLTPTDRYVAAIEHRDSG
jgi:hypothetical protein